MKIGILTLPLNYNYGGILQAYALQTVIERMGHEATVINFPFKLNSVSNLTKLKRLVKKILGLYNGYINFEDDFNKWLPKIETFTNQFINKYIYLSEPINNYNDIQQSDYDAIIVGSDQIWRPKMFQKDIRFAYLSFAKTWPIRRIAYAASFGTDQWEYSSQETKDCKELIRLFDAVSVREDSGIVLCKEHFDIDAVCVLDPTMLLDCKVYKDIIGKYASDEGNGKLFSYILDRSSENNKIIAKIEKELKLQAFSINSFDSNIKCELADRIAHPVEEWLKAIATSEFIVADSFHACVFAILFHRPFVVIDNINRGSSRIRSLLKKFQLEDRIININTSIKNLEVINYEKVDRLLSKYIEESIHFLTYQLKILK